ncbi:hypothetical protein VHEMI05540 [[Torrubiella] hemipterigena]|uniref:T-complex 11 n=1 Tax=[Torrubiella] hemipterigena TaxID=1531966 RepID=A0A0A1TGZ1_9HYPO|nr:hypothetical protein VHEMI05540 [[Torrubiella] hemipterigena]
MVPEQGTGFPVERSRRTMSTSAAGENEPRQETDVQHVKPVQDEQKTATIAQPSQESPRRCESAPRATSPGTSLRHNTPTVSRTSTPQAEARSPTSTTWPIEPPVTRATLSELDVTKIIHNPKLRHDINFDPELHFRPNLDGEKGRKKQDRANHFWTALKQELTEFITDRPTFYEKHGHTDDWTLPLLLKSVKDIIQTLVPQRDRQFLDDGLNVELLMQQFHKGVADLEKLALWLSQVLKSHCAPMRDDWVDAMYNQLSKGNRESNLDELVNGMRSLLSVLEAMKLDVANHQIRCLRPVLIEDTIHFEQKFFFKKIQARKIDIRPATAWYKGVEARYGKDDTHPTQAFGDSGIFFEGLSRLILPSSPESRLPSNFLFDEERILKLRSDMLDAVNLEICMRMYEDLERIGRLSNSGVFGNGPALDEETLKASEFNFNSPIDTSRPSSLAFSNASADSANSSPRSSVGLPAYVAPETSDAKSKARKVYGSLISLLQSTQPTMQASHRWESIAPSMALQIFRFTNAPTSLLATFEEKLTSSICRMDSNLYKEVEQAFHARLMSDLARRVQELRSLSGLSLFSVSTGSRVAGTAIREREFESPLRDSNDEGVIEDMAARLAHVGILHWRVWAQLAYVDDEEDDDSMAIDEPSQ